MNWVKFWCCQFDVECFFDKVNKPIVFFYYLFFYVHILYTHTHTHTHFYIYIYIYIQGSNWGGMRGGGGIPLVEKNYKKHPLCKATIPPYHPLWIINFVYYVKRIMHMKCTNSLLMINYEIKNGDWPIRTWYCNELCTSKAFWNSLKRRQQKLWFFLD